MENHECMRAVLDELARSVERGVSVWIGYVDNHGTSTERVCPTMDGSANTIRSSWKGAPFLTSWLSARRSRRPEASGKISARLARSSAA